MRLMRTVKVLYSIAGVGLVAVGVGMVYGVGWSLIVAGGLVVADVVLQLPRSGPKAEVPLNDDT